jgi:hypothetical protein
LFVTKSKAWNWRFDGWLFANLFLFLTVQLHTRRVSPSLMGRMERIPEGEEYLNSVKLERVINRCLVLNEDELDKLVDLDLILEWIC